MPVPPEEFKRRLGQTRSAGGKASVSAAATPSPAAPTPDPVAIAEREAADTERARILGIQQLGRPGEEEIVAECVADPKCSIGDALNRLRDAEESILATRILESHAQANGRRPAFTDDATARQILADYSAASGHAATPRS